MNAKKPPKFESGSRSHVAEEIEAAHRTFKDYLLRQHLSLWQPISTAPNNHDLELKVLDGGSSVVLPFKSAQATAQHRARFPSPQRTALERRMNDAGAKTSIGKRAVHELKEFLII